VSGLSVLVYYDGVNYHRFKEDNLAGVDAGTLAITPFTTFDTHGRVVYSPEVERIIRERDEAKAALEARAKHVVAVEQVWIEAMAERDKAMDEAGYWRKMFHLSLDKEAELLKKFGSAVEQRDEARAVAREALNAVMRIETKACGSSELGTALICYPWLRKADTNV
jgi:hypothetical protein